VQRVNRAAIESPMFDGAVLQPVAQVHADEYQGNVPFSHVVLDDLVPAEVVQEAIEEFPGPGDIQWNDKTHEYSKKAACEDMSLMGPSIRRLLFEMNSGVFIDFLETLTGISGIIPDPHLRGGGMHQIRNGGFLEVHADFNYHERLGLHRRLNLLLYLNDDWREEYGGHLELWNADLTRCEKRILPVCNRMVIFSTTDTAYHGHPEPLNCPIDRARNSLALYYYSKDRPARELSTPHSTLYRGDAVGRKAGLMKRLKAVLRRFWNKT